MRKVKGAVQPTRKVGDIDVEGEFLIEDFEYLIVGVIGCHKINTRANVLLLTVGHEVESECVAAGGDTISSFVISAV